MTPLHAVAIGIAGFVGGMLNSIAGGGTLVTFPTLLWHGLDPIRANATNALALWPGSLSGAWGYRRELGEEESRRYRILLVPSLVGGLLGAILLRLTPAPVFARLVPFLILFATLLFMLPSPGRRRRARSERSPRNLLVPCLFQLVAATYGGYFGAGMGIVILANLSLLGLDDIHRMNGLKNLFSFAINLVAALYFIQAGLIHWPEALVMMAGATAGGYASAGVARHLGRQFARRAVVTIGLVIALSLLVRR